jgi:hypothetical protein
MKIKYFLAVVLLVIIGGCKPKETSDLSIGKWRGVFNAQGWLAPFNFTVQDDAAGVVKVFLTNGEERFPLSVRQCSL